MGVVAGQDKNRKTRAREGVVMGKVKTALCCTDVMVLRWLQVIQHAASAGAPGESHWMLSVMNKLKVGLITSDIYTSDIYVIPWSCAASPSSCIFHILRACTCA